MEALRNAEIKLLGTSLLLLTCLIINVFDQHSSNLFSKGIQHELVLLIFLNLKTKNLINSLEKII